ncbi:MAG: hypothetical protein K6E36_00990 [Oscillospiraceae bacterium]|nr:hypothetical protein [Oscillospiraceae bacterium]
MQVCPHCGKETQEGGFCTACGGALPVGTANESKLLKSAEANEKTVQFCKKWLKVAMVIALGFLVLLIIDHIRSVLDFWEKVDEMKKRFGASGVASMEEERSTFIDFNGFYVLQVIVFAAVSVFLNSMSKLMQKSKLSVFTDHVSICCPEKYFKVQQADLKYPDITSSAVSSSFRAQNECVVLTSGGKSYSIPVNDADAMCQLIQKQKEAQA